MNAAEVAAVGLLGGLLGLDTVSFPQAMFSRPLVACTIGASFAGQPLAGLLLGVLVESFALEILPVGASRYPEWGAASVVGGALAARTPDIREGTIVVSLVATLAIAWAGGWSMVQLRQLNAWWAHRHAAGIRAGDRRTVVGLQVYGLLADLVRGTAVAVCALLVFAPLTERAARGWALDPILTRAILVTVGGVMAAGAVYKVFHGVAWTRWYLLAGLAVGLALVALT